MTSASKLKGNRAEMQVRDLLRRHTGYAWERVPGSGALQADHDLKGDLYIPKYNNVCCIEVKHYKDDQLTSKILTDKTPILVKWWDQTIREAGEVDKIPLLIFKKDRGKFFLALQKIFIDTINSRYIYYSEKEILITLLEPWLIHNNDWFWVE